MDKNIVFDDGKVNVLDLVPPGSINDKREIYLGNIGGVGILVPELDKFLKIYSNLCFDDDNSDDDDNFFTINNYSVRSITFPCALKITNEMNKQYPCESPNESPYVIPTKPELMLVVNRIIDLKINGYYRYLASKTFWTRTPTLKKDDDHELCINKGYFWRVYINDSYERSWTKEKDIDSNYMFFLLLVKYLFI